MRTHERFLPLGALVFTLAGVTFAAGCAANAAQSSPQAPSKRTATSPADLERLRQIAAERAKIQPAESYTIGEGDLLEINVFDLDEMNRTTRVASSGFVQLPMIGAVQAKGKTEAELAAEIASRLEKNFLQNPQVFVFIKEFNSQQVAVTGSVAKPGLYPLTRKRYTILDMISQGGGLTNEAGAVIEFIPALEGKPSAAFEIASTGSGIPAASGENGPASADQSISIDLGDLLRGGSRASLNIPVAAGDVIYVPEAGSFTVEGWVEKPGTYPLTRNTSVLAAISAGGGPLFPAKLTDVQIMRTGNQGQTRDLQSVDLDAVRAGRAADVPLRSGDIVRVPATTALLPIWGVYSLVQGLVRVSAGIPVF
jgi:polysaccharide export outer membrane protein